MLTQLTYIQYREHQPGRAFFTCNTFTSMVLCVVVKDATNDLKFNATLGLESIRFCNLFKYKNV